MTQKPKITTEQIEIHFEKFRTPNFQNSRQEEISKQMRDAIMDSPTSAMTVDSALELGQKFGLSIKEVALGLYTAGAALGFSLNEKEEENGNLN